MLDSCKTIIDGCLYFQANSLARHLNEIADEAFKVLGIAPAYAYVILVILEEPGLTQSKLGQTMNLKASTVTRFVEKLILQGLITKKQEGRTVKLFPTDLGISKKAIIEQGLKMLHNSYADKLGDERAQELTHLIYSANNDIVK